MQLPPPPRLLPPTRSADATGANFLRVLLLELHKVSGFYVDKAEELEVGRLPHIGILTC